MNESLETSESEARHFDYHPHSGARIEVEASKPVGGVECESKSVANYGELIEDRDDYKRLCYHKDLMIADLQRRLGISLQEQEYLRGQIANPVSRSEVDGLARYIQGITERMERVEAATLELADRVEKLEAARQPSDVETERIAFEHWARIIGFNLERWLEGNIREYKDSSAEYAWIGWKAARSKGLDVY